jgi:hypothetical protein
VMPSVDVASLPGEWWLVSGSDSESLESELRREAPSGRRLVGVAVVPACVKRHLDDVVFWLPETRQWALVHLTYHVETDPQWPSTYVYDDWDVLVRDLAAD